MHTIPDCYLASTSPRRAELLRQIGVHFETVAIEVDESHLDGESVDVYVKRLAIAKANAGQSHLMADRPVLGADTVVYCDGQIMGKPSDAEHAHAMLMQLSNRSHQVYSAVAVVTYNRTLAAVSSTKVSFRSISSQDATAYWRTGEPKGKAGGYAIQGIGAVFVTGIHGCYSTVVGLPIATTAELLASFKIHVLSSNGL